MGKESALCKVRDDSACEQNGESRCFRVSLRQPQGQLCWLSLLLLLLPTAMADVPTPLAPRQGFGLLWLQQAPGAPLRAWPGPLDCAVFGAWFSSGSSFGRWW